ncbi:MAG: PIN domain-containing protein, partial [Pseudaminobacter sp.]|nr:PIN domain-containing protein [Pseudaminobacter sp.]
PYLATSEITLAELLVHPIRRGDTDRVVVYETTISPSAVLTVKSVDRAVLRDAGRLRAFHPTLRLPDAIHLSSALFLKSPIFLTADQKLLGWVPDPADYFENFARLRLTSPDLSTLRGLISELSS